MAFVIHLLVPSDKGPIKTEPGGSTFKVNKGGKYSILCDRQLELNGTTHRGTDCPWAATCPACIEKAKDAKMNLTHPNEREVE